MFHAQHVAGSGRDVAEHRNPLAQEDLIPHRGIDKQLPTPHITQNGRRGQIAPHF